MKKILICIFIILSILVGLTLFNNSKDKVEVANKNNIENSTDIMNEAETNNSNTYFDTNPITLGIYLYDKTTNKRYLADETTDKWTYHNDIHEFNVIFTQKKEIEGSPTRECFPKYMNNYNNISDYRTGFHIKFKTEDEVFDKTIISPKDVDDFFEYLEVYLYDGYHRAKGEWYSHTTEEEFNKNTIFTTIKLTAGKSVSKITSSIELTAFSYIGDDDFDSNGNYRGNSKYSIVLNNSSLNY